MTGVIYATPAPTTTQVPHTAVDSLYVSRAEKRERIAAQALQGLLAATPDATQSTSNADQYAARAVRYADALIEALNRAHVEASHARQR